MYQYIIIIKGMYALSRVVSMDQYIIIIKGMYALSGVGVNGPVFMDLMDQARELPHQVQYWSMILYTAL